ncbi:MAG: hypothetical protein IJZ42_01430 [Lachnospiraceae bacterium]|nr:hypothetical protein [Lachnospiraceae bacterium]
MVIELPKIMRNRFYSWAAEYITANDITIFPPSEFLAFLVENKVFTFDEIRTELDKRKIIFHEDYFDLAKKYCNEQRRKKLK